jgi:luciferase-type oxidoreductase
MERHEPLAAPRAHPGFASLFRARRLTLGVFFPIEAFEGSSPTMAGQVELAQRAEAMGFDALWFRDVPLLDPSFGDAGQIYDPWVYLGYIAAQTTRIALATGSIVLPLRHPLHVAKAAASVDALTGGRLLLGVATGDRPIEYPAFGQPFDSRDEAFRESIAVLRAAWSADSPGIRSTRVNLSGAALVPKPPFGTVPLLVTGRARQSLDWIARHADAWMSYPRDPGMQAGMLDAWRAAQFDALGRTDKPFAQSLYIDLAEDASRAPLPIHLGYRLGDSQLLALLRRLAALGVSHVALNLKYSRRPAGEVLDQLGRRVLPALRDSPVPASPPSYSPA